MRLMVPMLKMMHEANGCVFVVTLYMELGFATGK